MRKRQTLNTQFYDSPCGKLILAAMDDELYLCDWYGRPCAERNKYRLERVLRAHFTEASSTVLEQTKRELDEYFEGKRKSFDIPLHTVGTDFQKQVWETLLEIPYGETRSYMEASQRLDNTKGIRAVAQAIGSNGLSIFIPCHRVIGSNSSLTGFSGGIEAKKILLDLESRFRPTDKQEGVV